jgi:hypothetical protein
MVRTTKQGLKLIGSSRRFLVEFRRMVEDIGIRPNVQAVEDIKQAVFPRRGAFVCEVRNTEDVGFLSEKSPKRPFLVFLGLRLKKGDISILRHKRLVGVISRGLPEEDVSFLISKALFYSGMLRKNPRASLGMPVRVSTGDGRVIKSVSTQLSRDGMFVSTINPLQRGSLCRLDFAMPKVRKRFSTIGKVLYTISINKELNIISDPKNPFKRLVAHPGMAIYFVDMKEEDRDAIDSRIKEIC